MVEELFLTATIGEKHRDPVTRVDRQGWWFVARRPGEAGLRRRARLADALRALADRVDVSPWPSLSAPRDAA